MMNLITATELRTNTKGFIDFLLNGEEVQIVHRSKIIGVVKPKKVKGETFDVETFMRLTSKINLPILSDREIDKKYRAAMIKKHGKHLSGRKYNF